MTSLIILTSRRFPLHLGGSWRRIAAHILASLAIVGVIEATCSGIEALIATGALAPGAVGEQLRQRVAFLAWDLALYWIVVAIATAALASQRAARDRARAASLERDVAEARLEALRSQLHPHFLFNALNSVASLVRQNRSDDAIEVIDRLSGVLRRVIDAPAGHLVSLDEEMTLIEDYLAIEQRRYGDRLSVEIDIDDAACDWLVPVLVLQPLVENAIRHGIGADPAGGTVTIGARTENGRLVLDVRNSSGRSARGIVEGAGLSNLRARLEQIYADGAQLTITSGADGRGACARISIETPSTRGGEP